MPFLRSHRHEIDWLTEETFPKDTKGMAPSDTDEDWQEGSSSCSERWHPCHGIQVCPPSLVHTRKLVSSLWALGTHFHLHLYQGHDIPMSRKGETFSVYLQAPTLPRRLDTSHKSLGRLMLTSPSRLSLMLPGLWRKLLVKARDETSGRLHICCNSDYLHPALGLGSGLFKAGWTVLKPSISWLCLPVILVHL